MKQRITKAHKLRFEKIKRIGCIACIRLPMTIRNVTVASPCGVIEAHHLLSGGRRRGHDATIPLGQWHHQGIPLSGWRANDMEAVFGPSLKSSKRFHALFGSDDDLLRRVNELIQQRVAA